MAAQSRPPRASPWRHSPPPSTSHPPSTARPPRCAGGVAWSGVWWWACVGVVVLASSVLADDCIVPKTYPHFITGDMHTVDSSTCYTCYHSPRGQKFSVDVREVRLVGMVSVMIYVDSKQKHVTDGCGGCGGDGCGGDGCGEGCGGCGDGVCQECDISLVGTMFEMYVRLRSPEHDIAEGESQCQNLSYLNISLAIVEGESNRVPTEECAGGVMTSLPITGDACVINTTDPDAKPETELVCLVPTCSEGLITPDLTHEKIEHKFLPSDPAATCIWELNTEQRKHLTLRFSQNLRPHIKVFEASLHNPKWNLEWCPVFGNEVELQAESDTMYVVYHNTKKLSKKATLAISTRPDLCLLPPGINNGLVEFERHESGTVAFYRCEKGFGLHGAAEVRCRNRVWEEPPVCVPQEEDKLMSDAPVAGVEEGGNGTSLGNGTAPLLTLPDDQREVEGKMGEEVMAEEELKLAEEKAREEQYEEEISSELTTVLEEEGNVEDEGEEETEVQEEEEVKEVEEEGFLEDFPSSNHTEVGLDDNDVFEPSGDLNVTSSSELDLLANLLELNLEDELTLYTVIGAGGFIVLLIITIISVIIYKKRYPVRLGLGRKFDTFQNPIYEKTVVRMPLQVEETEVGCKKSDTEELSDCTVLE